LEASPNFWEKKCTSNKRFNLSKSLEMPPNFCAEKCSIGSIYPKVWKHLQTFGKKSVPVIKGSIYPKVWRCLQTFVKKKVV